MSVISPLRLVFAALLALSVTACDSSEERAEEHYQAGMALLDKGDVERALVEFRNVFKLNGEHRDARAAYARAVMGQGNLSGAYAQYLRLVEQYPDDAEALLALAEISFQAGNWQEFDRFSQRAIDAQPGTQGARLIDIAADYRQAMLDEDDGARQEAGQRAIALSGEGVESEILFRILIDGYLRDGKYDLALEQIDNALEKEPDSRMLYSQKLAVLSQLQDLDAIETVLKTMVSRFEGDQDLEGSLIRYYLSRGQVEEAEAFLREIADPTAEEPVAYLSLIQFISRQYGAEVALKEIEDAIVHHPDLVVLRQLQAGLDFELGRQQKAITSLETLLADNPDAPQHDIKITLARMLNSTGNDVGARRLVEEVLAGDSSHVEALKMRASWQIASDQVDEAISGLRTALDQNPQDAQAMTLMADAYIRQGSHELARDFLSLAVEASGNAPAESVRFARLLRSEERFLPAEDTLVAALRVSRGNVEVLSELGSLYLEMEDLSRAEQVAETLNRLEDPRATAAADAISLGVLEKREGPEEAIAFLEQVAESDGDIRAKAGVVRARLLNGETEEALSYAREMIETDPENEALRYVLYAALAAAGDLEAAAEGYREMLDKYPDRDRIWLELVRVTVAQGKPAEAAALIDEGLEKNPESANLMWAKASVLEKDGDIAGAIEIYETLYERASGSLVVANNLASLLSMYTDDQETLDRAYAVARRLRGSNVAAFQDTYGWIAYRRGNYEEALEYLEPAADALQRDPMAQYHLGMTYLQLGREDDARRTLRRALDIAGAIDTRPEIARIRDELRKLQPGQSE